MLNVCRLPFRHGRPGSFVFAFRRREDGLHASRQAAVEIAGLEARRDLLVNDALAQRVGQHAFQPVADLQKQLVFLHENEQHRAVVLVLLPHLP